jgi:hypothetical protein
MGLPAGALAGIGVGLSAFSAGFGFLQARGQANAEIEAANIRAQQATQQAKAQYEEIDRQQREVNRIAEEQRADRVRKADQELGSLRVLAGERGLSGTTFFSMAQEVGYWSGLDISRINENRDANIAAGEASKKSAQQGALNTIQIAQNQAKVASHGVGLAAIGTGLQIVGAGVDAYTDYKNHQDEMDLMNNILD